MLGDNDSKENARQRCLAEAKRKILERAGVLVESKTRVTDTSITNDEMSSYAIGTLRIKHQEERLDLNNGHLTITLTVTAEVDPAEIHAQFIKYRAAQNNNMARPEEDPSLVKFETLIEGLQTEDHWESFPGAKRIGVAAQRQSYGEKLSGSLSPENIQKLTTIAANGNARAQNCLGWLYKWGLGVEWETEKAKAWLEKAAATGSDKAELSLYEVNRHNPVDWLVRAAEHGNAIAQGWLGQLYAYHGMGVPHDMAQARHWLQKAASQGVWQSQLMLGSMYSSGMGVPLDNVRAYMWYSLVITNVSADQDAKKQAAEHRDWAERSMSPAQITEAQRMECVNHQLKGC
jgi:TPR repeat protein